jgi:hypothetical protein
VKTNLEFFCHRANTGGLPAFRALSRRHGNDGYACYWRLLESACSAPGLKIDLAEPLISETIAEDWGLRDLAHLHQILDTMAQLGLICPQLWRAERVAYPEEMAAELQERLELRARDRDRKKKMSTRNPRGIHAESTRSPADSALDTDTDTDTDTEGDPEKDQDLSLDPRAEIFEPREREKKKLISATGPELTEASPTSLPCLRGEPETTPQTNIGPIDQGRLLDFIQGKNPQAISPRAFAIACLNRDRNHWEALYAESLVPRPEPEPPLLVPLAPVTPPTRAEQLARWRSLWRIPGCQASIQKAIAVHNPHKITLAEVTEAREVCAA